MRIKLSDAVLLLSEKFSGIQYDSEWKKIMDRYNLDKKSLENLKKSLKVGNFKIKHKKR